MRIKKTICTLLAIVSMIAIANPVFAKDWNQDETMKWICDKIKGAKFANSIVVECKYSIGYLDYIEYHRGNYYWIHHNIPVREIYKAEPWRVANDENGYAYAVKIHLNKSYKQYMSDTMSYLDYDLKKDKSTAILNTKIDGREVVKAFNHLISLNPDKTPW